MLKRLAGSWTALVVVGVIVVLLVGELLSRAGANTSTAFIIGAIAGAVLVWWLRKKYA